MPFLLRFEPDILLRAKQDFMKTDSATDLEWVPFKMLCDDLYETQCLLTNTSISSLSQVYERAEPGAQRTLSRERTRPWERVSESRNLWRGEMWGSNSSCFSFFCFVCFTKTRCCWQNWSGHCRHYINSWGRTEFHTSTHTITQTPEGNMS